MSDMNEQANNMGNPSVEVKDLRKSFDGNEVLKGINMNVRKGEIFVIMGPSGSGKSVLLRHMVGLNRADSGSVSIEGKIIDSPEVLSKYRVAMVFQSGALLGSLTVAENVGLYLKEHRLKKPAEIDAIVKEKLAIVGLTGAEDRMPPQLSGGMKKRVAIARALVMEPQLILYDEPTSELDPLIAVTIGHEIVRMRDQTGATSIVVTHDRGLGFGIADRMAILRDGELVAFGTPEEVRNSEREEVQTFLNATFERKNTTVATQ
jgi:phospholipid/cholesterol/gamma-HCH transport system ATP-binding protein